MTGENMFIFFAYFSDMFTNILLYLYTIYTFIHFALQFFFQYIISLGCHSKRFPFRSTALCVSVLKDLGVTAVLNAAMGDMPDWNYVNTKARLLTHSIPTAK